MADHNIESVNIHAAWLHRIRGLGLKTILRLYHGLFYEDSAVLKASFPIQHGAVIVLVTLILPFMIGAVLLRRKLAGEEL